MKSHCHLKAFGSFLFLLIGLNFTLNGQNSSPTPTSSLSVGSEVQLEKAVDRSDLVIIGQISSIGHPAGQHPIGQEHYQGVTVRVLKVIKGSIGAETTVDFFVNKIKKHLVENTPAVGEQYILFLKNDQWKSVTKLLPATQEEISKVEDLLNSQPSTTGSSSAQ